MEDREPVISAVGQPFRLSEALDAGVEAATVDVEVTEHLVAMARDRIIGEVDEQGLDGVEPAPVCASIGPRTRTSSICAG